MAKSRYQSKAALITLPQWVPIEALPMDSEEGGIKIDAHPLGYKALYLWEEGAGVPQMPVLIQGDGRPWRLGNLCLMHWLQQTYELKGSVNMQTVRSRAAGLVDYLRWLEDTGSDPMSFPRKPFLRVTYRYNRALHQQVASGALATSTARRFISSVAALYRSIALVPLIPEFEGFDNPPFEDKTTWFSISSSSGSENKIKILSTDLSQSLRIPRKTAQHSQIMDGGSLKPLTETDQVLLLKQLNQSPNIEMRLMHYIALFTGARVQTICTLRVGLLKHQRTPGLNYMNIPVGRGTCIDTKGDKQQVLQFPTWLLDMITTYCRSERAARRLAKFGDDYGDENYIFLSQQGNPYYRSRYDEAKGRSIRKTRVPRDAGSIREYVKTLRKEIQESNPEFFYRFHDLRATFGMNLVNRHLEQIEHGEISYISALEMVKTRMGHTSRETTEKYLKYQNDNQVISSLQDDYERHLMSLIKEDQ